MTSEQMDFKNTIARLVSVDSDQKPTVEQLGNLIEAIAQAVIGDVLPSSSEKINENELFGMLAEAVQPEQHGIFRELVETEKQIRTENEPTLLMAAVMKSRSYGNC